MSKKQVLILWIIAGILTTALAVVRTNQSKGPSYTSQYSRGDQLASGFDVEKTTKIVIKDHTQQVTLVKGEQAWTVLERHDYPADLPRLSQALETLQEAEVARTLNAGPSYDARFGMDEQSSEAADHGTSISFRDASDQELFRMQLGKQTDSGTDPANPLAGTSQSGRFSRISTDPDNVYVINTPLREFFTDPKMWLEQKFVAVSQIKSITLRSLGDSSIEPWTITREDDNSEFAVEGLGEDEEASTGVLSPLKGLFSNGRFVDVVEPDTVETDGDPSKAYQAIINTFQGFTYTFDLTPKKMEQEPAKDDFNPTAENYFATVSVTGTFASSRQKKDDETPEEAAAADKAFATELEALQTKLSKEQKIQGRAFELSKWSLGNLIQKRSDFVKKKSAENEVEAPAPGTSAASPPIQVPLAPPSQ